MIFKTAAVDAIIIYFGNKIDENLLKKITFYFKNLKALKNPYIITLIPSYTSIYIRYDIFRFSENSFIDYIKEQFTNFADDQQKSDYSKLVKIPTFYSKKTGLDLDRISKEKNLKIDEIIELHSQKIYLVYAIGFMPGFAYLAKVDEKIRIPRLKHPRDTVPKGSVAVADNQCAVYPKESPGGWNIIGRTTMKLFNKKLKTLCPLEIGDRVKFEPISKKEYLSLDGTL